MSEDPTRLLPEDGFKLILARLDSMDARLERLEARNYDTKPLWERALAEIMDVKAELTKVNQRLDNLDARFEELNARQEQMSVRQDEIAADVGEIKKEMRDLNKRMDNLDRSLSVLNDDILHMRGEYRKLDRRLLEIETQAA